VQRGEGGAEAVGGSHGSALRPKAENTSAATLEAYTTFDMRECADAARPIAFATLPGGIGSRPGCQALCAKLSDLSICCQHGGFPCFRFLADSQDHTSVVRDSFTNESDFGVITGEWGEIPTCFREKRTKLRRLDVGFGGGFGDDLISLHLGNPSIRLG
jgi:hypothetical protein